jgi:hypothetical protein
MAAQKGKISQSDLQQMSSIAYTITSGFYPELASSIKFGKVGHGTGAVGSKHFKKRGFDNSSIRRIKAEAKREAAGKDAIPSAFRRHMPGKKKRLNFAGDMTYENPDFWQENSPTGSAYIKREKATKSMGKFYKPNQQIAKTLGTGTAFNEDDTGLMAEAAAAGEQLQKVSYSKWMGGHEMYKLYGTKVWYMEGLRKKETIDTTLASWANAVADGDTGALPENYLNQLYSRSEKYLVRAAKAMAEEIFDAALDEKNVQPDLEALGRGGADVPEEDILEAQKGMKEGMKDYARQSDIEIDKESYANKLDVLTRSADNTEDLYLDSTEMGLGTDDGHGIISPTGTVKKAIAQLKDPKDDKQIEVLRQAVIKMFMKNIDNDYNPIIEHLKGAMEDDTDDDRKSESATFKGLLKMVKEEREKLNNLTSGLKPKQQKQLGRTPAAVDGEINQKHISVQNIAAAAGLRMGKSMTLSSTKNMVQEQAMRYVVHMLANLGDGQERRFRQGHRVATWDDGYSTYASVPMEIIDEGANAMLFYGTATGATEANSPLGTEIILGASHLLALADNAGRMREGKQYEVQRNQAQAHYRSRIHHSRRGSSTYSQIGAQYDAKRKCHGTTRVSFSPKALTKQMTEVMRAFRSVDGKMKLSGGKPIGHALPKLEGVMKEHIRSWPTKPTRQLKERGSLSGKQYLNKSGLVNANRFWALPYIGINDSIYRGGKGKDPGMKAATSGKARK